MKTITLAITGASGAIYGWDLALKLNSARNVKKAFFIVSNAGKIVLKHELGIEIKTKDDFLSYGLDKFHLLENNDLSASISSGSNHVDAMIIAPCTMGTLGCIASGLAQNLIHRAADVVLKEKRSLILVPRESPLNIIHIENMLRVAKAGATILPAMPSFYSKPKDIQALIDTITNRVLKIAGIDHDKSYSWKFES